MLSVCCAGAWIVSKCLLIGCICSCDVLNRYDMSVIYIFMYPPITFSVLSFFASSNKVLKQNIEAEYSQNKEQNNKLEVACICVIFY